MSSGMESQRRKTQMSRFGATDDVLTFVLLAVKHNVAVHALRNLTIAPASMCL